MDVSNVVKISFFEDLDKAQQWALAQCQPAQYLPKNPLWRDLQAHYLKNGLYVKIRYHQSKLGYVVTVYRSEYWAEKQLR